MSHRTVKGRKATKAELREIRRLVDKSMSRFGGLAWGAAGRAGGCHFVIHDGAGAGSNWTSVTFSNENLRAFADRFVRSVTNAEHVPAIRALIEAEQRGLRAEIRRLRCLVLEQQLAARPVSPYSDATALVVAPCTALAVAEGRAS